MKGSRDFPGSGATTIWVTGILCCLGKSAPRHPGNGYFLEMGNEMGPRGPQKLACLKMKGMKTKARKSKLNKIIEMK